MTSPTKRRPLPALVFLLALCLLAALVWWRVLHRDSGHAVTHPSCPTSQAPTQLPEPGAITVTVLNSTKRNGIAAAARTVLIKDGFKVPDKAANDDASLGGHGLIPEAAEIRSGPAATDAAKLLSYYFPGAKMVTTQSSDSTVVVSLGAKYKSVASATAVASALKADGLTLKATTGAPSSAATPSGTSC